jgi:hypothetical protein
MTEKQREKLRMILQFYDAEETFHHGDCVGSDKEAHDLAAARKMRIHVHPPDNDKARAHCYGAHETSEPKPYIERNHDIVDACNPIVATPETHEEELRSGTWATVRYARKKGKTVITIWPDGMTRTEN